MIKNHFYSQVRRIIFKIAHGWKDIGKYSLDNNDGENGLLKNLQHQYYYLSVVNKEFQRDDDEDCAVFRSSTARTGCIDEQTISLKESGGPASYIMQLIISRNI